MSEQELASDIRAIRKKVEDIENEQGRSWITDKRVPIAVLFAIALQTFGAVWWASKVTSAVEQNADSINQLSVDVLTHKGSGPHPEARVELAELRIMVSQLIRSVDRLTGKIEERGNNGSN